MKKIIYIILAVIFFLPLHTDAKEVFDTKGKEFWLAFPPNYHNGYSDKIPDYYSDSLYIFINSDEPTTGTIEYYDRNGQAYVENVNIDNPNEMFIFKISHYNFETKGYNHIKELLTNNNPKNQNEKISHQSFHILMDSEVTVYAHSQAKTTSDAFLVFPADVLGVLHYILTYNSDGAFEWPFEITGSTPSQFLIVSTQDNTDITITPSDRTRVNRRKIQNFTMNEGDVYLVQSGITYNNMNNDLSGSKIESSKPIAVFAGHQRSLIPLTTNGASRDYLVEQMPSVDTWGQNAFIIPYAQPLNVMASGDDIVRVLAANDNTDVFIENSYFQTLDEGEFFELPLIDAMPITSTGQVLIAQFKKTSGGSTRNGDPFMMLIPPTEQFMTEYRIISTQAYENNTKVYEEHYITIVAPDTATANIILDGNKINSSEFTNISGSDYSYTHQSVSEGIHTIKAKVKFGVYVYGYGAANSYGYVGGMSMIPLEPAPALYTIDSCYSITGIFYDTTTYDTGINRITVSDETSENVNVSIDVFSPFADSVKFRATLIDNFLDGYFEIIAYDSTEMMTHREIEIPGFTVSLSTILGGNPPVVRKNYRSNRMNCEKFIIENYGKFEHGITNIYLKNNSIDIFFDNLPISLSSGETSLIELCAEFNLDTLIIDTLVIVDECSEREILIIEMQFNQDKISPEYEITYDNCNRFIDITFADSTYFDWGIELVTVDTTINCRVNTNYLSPQIANISVIVEDRFKDAIFTITGIDSMRNSISISDTIQGFTIAFTQFPDTINYIDFEKQKIGSYICNSVQIMNTGILPFTFENAIMLHNLLFSLPQMQFPFTLQPGETKNMEICYHPQKADNEINSDTLKLFFNCLEMEVLLSGIAEEIDYFGDSDCDVPLKFTINSVSSDYFLDDITPNPITDMGKIKFGIKESGNTIVRIYDTQGNVILEILNQYLEKGIFELEINFSKFSTGLYFCRMISGNSNFSRKISITR